MIASYESVSRDVLNSMPYAALLPLATVICVGGALLALYLVRRFLGEWRSGADAAVIGGVAAMVLTLFALLLAFGIVTLYNQHQDARNAVAKEADDLAQVGRDAGILTHLGIQPTATVSEPINGYICAVETHEFEAMRDG
jgi:hypothetical protein